MKTKEEIKELKEEHEALATKLNELTKDELEQTTGGGNVVPFVDYPCFLHHNDIFIDETGLFMTVYTGPDREIENAYVSSLPIEFYDKEDFYSSDLRFVYTRSGIAVAKFLFFYHIHDGNVADGKYILVNK